MISDTNSFNICEVLLINPSANAFVFGDFNVHHKNWLTYSSGIDRPGDLCYNCSISNNLAQMINFPTLSLTLPPLGNSDHVVSVSTDFPSNSKWNAASSHSL